jgi:branched-chain amino acid transport system permease protein
LAFFGVVAPLFCSIPKITLQGVAQLTVVGILSGGVYAVAAVGLALVFGVMRIMNLAHGAFIVLGSYFTYWAFNLLGLDPFLSVAVTAFALFVIGVVVERVTIDPVITMGFDQPVIITFALLLIIENLIKLLWTSDVRGLSTSYSSSSIHIGSTSIPAGLLGIFVVSVASTLIIHLFLTKTYTGKSLRATSQDFLMAESMGVDTRRAYQLAFGIGSACAGVAGSLIAAGYAFEPSTGDVYLFKAFAVIALAGIGNVKTVMVAGILLGLLEVFGGYFLGGGIKDAFSYVIFLAVLIIRPSGLAGKTRI